MDISFDWIPEMGVYLLRELVSRKLIDSSEAKKIEGILQAHYRSKDT